MSPRAEALVVVDVQRGWVSGPHAVAGGEALVPVLESAAAAARAAGAVVVHVQDVGDEDSSVPAGSSGRELVLPVEPSDAVVPKLAGDAFAGPGLEALLRSRGVRSVVVAGLQSEMCVADTARTALRLGFAVVLPRDAHATRDIQADGAAAGVPAAQVARVAEWSLGDELVVVERVASVQFAPEPGNALGAEP